MTFIKAEDFKEFLNPLQIKRDGPDAVFVEVNVPNEYTSSILIQSKRDYIERITIEFSVKFSHHEHEEEGMFQREFSIEHHPPERSRHDKPHLQFHIHGLNPEQKVGKIWLTLDLESDEEYEKCIEGFFYVLEEIAEICRDDLDDKLLNKPEIYKLTKQKELLLSKIQESLKTKGIEYEFPDGTEEKIYQDNIEKITSQDKTLIPLLEKN